MTRAWGLVRVCAAAAGHHGRHILGPLYTAIGTRLHHQRRREDPAVIAEALAEAGLPGSLAAAATSTEFDQLIKDSHDEAFDEVGLDVGTPVLRIAGKALFGSVITPAPRGEAAGQLWDGLVMIARTDGFFELKRSRESRWKWSGSSFSGRARVNTGLLHQFAASASVTSAGSRWPPGCRTIPYARCSTSRISAPRTSSTPAVTCIGKLRREAKSPPSDSNRMGSDSSEAPSG